jgi:hypothetical protein
MWATDLLSMLFFNPQYEDYDSEQFRQLSRLGLTTSSNPTSNWLSSNPSFFLSFN